MMFFHVLFSTVIIYYLSHPVLSVVTTIRSDRCALVVINALSILRQDQEHWKLLFQFQMTLFAAFFCKGI